MSSSGKMAKKTLFKDDNEFSHPSSVMITDRTIMDAVPDLIFVLDRTGMILEANRTACELLGYERIEFTGRKFGSFIAGDVLKNCSLLIQEQWRKNAGAKALLWTRQSELLLVSVWITPQFDNKGECAGLLVVARTSGEKNNKWNADISKLMENAQSDLSHKKSETKCGENIAAENRRQSVKRIMVVDDEEIIRRVVQDIVSTNFSDITVEVAGSGEEALERTKKRSYDLVFLDMKMRTVDGLETYRRLRNENPEQKVIIVTGYFDEEKNRIAKMDGICGTIYKPFTVEQITDAIERYVLQDPVMN